MMGKCVDAGTIQAFLDGELGQDLSAKVAGHIAVCDSCVLAMAEAEEESAFAFTALGQGFNTLVPTNRLWTKINDSIEQKKSISIWQTIFGNFKVLFANPSIAAFASLLIVAGIFAVLWNSGTSDKSESLVAKVNKNTKSVIAQTVTTTQSPISSINDNFVKPQAAAAKSNDDVKDETPVYRVVKASFRNSSKGEEKKRQDLKSTKGDNFQPPVRTASAAYLPGEETYLKTIATLEKTVDSRKDELLKPSARFSYERDLAVVNDAIETMKKQVKKNPKNEAAKKILLSSYQNKVDLLSSVADKNDLMASLR